MSIENQIESLLFISHKPLSIKELAKLMSVEIEEIKNALAELEKKYETRAGGIKLLKIDDKYQMATAGDSGEIVKKFIKSEMTGELTRPSLEALTVIAYRGPISKAELEIIRGVNCSLILRNLLMRGLIEAEEDKKKAVTAYRITFDFLKYLGLSKVEELPDFEKLNRNNNLEKLLQGVENINN
ncbi:MAG: SMC-Scp complex subunit ScpB [Patescibacteria group bacterium]